MRKPWINPPQEHTLGTGRGPWKIAISVVIVAVITVIVLLSLVAAGQLADRWVYLALPIGLFSAAAALVMTVFKAAGESKKT